jgi:MFS family permease
MAGLASVPWAVGAALSAVLGGQVVFRYGRALVATGLVLVILGLLGAWLAIGLVDGTAVGWAVAGPFFVAGIGNGIVIAPNQSLSLADVPPRQGGAAGGVLQTGQRIGSAAGIAAVGSVFYSELPDYPGAVRVGFLMIIGFVLVALAVATADLVTSRRR